MLSSISQHLQQWFCPEARILPGSPIFWMEKLGHGMQMWVLSQAAVGAAGTKSTASPLQAERCRLGETDLAEGPELRSSQSRGWALPHPPAAGASHRGVTKRAELAAPGDSQRQPRHWAAHSAKGVALDPLFVKKRNQKYYYFLALKALLDPTLSHSLSPTCEKSGLHHEASACARCGLSVCPSARDHHCSTAVEEGRRRLDSPRVWLRLPGTGEEARRGTTAPSAGQEPQEQSSQKTPRSKLTAPGRGSGLGQATKPLLGWGPRCRARQHPARAAPIPL